MKYRVTVVDNQTKLRTENIIVIRKNTSMVTLVLKGLEAHLEANPSSDNEESLKLIKSIKRECNNELDTFLTDLEQELDYLISIGDLNNHTYQHIESKRTITSYDVGFQSYERAWEGQVNEEDGEKDLKKYLPPIDYIIEHGNDLMADDVDTDNENWEIVEWITLSLVS